MSKRKTAVIVDDEPIAIDVIVAYLKSCPDIELIGTFEKSRDAAAKIPELKPDLLFLDIQMPVLNGFELIEAIIDKHNPYIIFTTAYDQYALQAFEVNAIGYLLKPFSKEKFDKALARFLNPPGKDDELYSGIVNLLSGLKPGQYSDKIIIREQKKIFYLPVTAIIYFEASGDYVSVVTAGKTYLINDSLSALEKKLSPQAFVRIHRSSIINTAQVKAFIPYFNSEYKIVMSNDVTLKMSRNYRDNLLRAFPEL